MRMGEGVWRWERGCGWGRECGGDKECGGRSLSPESLPACGAASSMRGTCMLRCCMRRFPISSMAPRCLLSVTSGTGTLAASTSRELPLVTPLDDMTASSVTCSPGRAAVISCDIRLRARGWGSRRIAALARRAHRVPVTAGGPTVLETGGTPPPWRVFGMTYRGRSHCPALASMTWHMAGNRLSDAKAARGEESSPKLLLAYVGAAVEALHRVARREDVPDQGPV